MSADFEESDNGVIGEGMDEQDFLVSLLFDSYNPKTLEHVEENQWQSPMDLVPDSMCAQDSGMPFINPEDRLLPLLRTFLRIVFGKGTRQSRWNLLYLGWFGFLSSHCVVLLNIAHLNEILPVSLVIYYVSSIIITLLNLNIVRVGGGRVNSLTRTHNNDNESDYENVQCDQCKKSRPMRSKHCFVCRRCIPYIDHHCPWLGVCIGQQNIFDFFIFMIIILVNLFCLRWLLLDILSSDLSLKSLSIFSWLFRAALRQPVVVLGLYTLHFIAFSIFGLLIWMIVRISVGVTTNELFNKNRLAYMSKLKSTEANTPFNLGFVNNWVEFVRQKRSIGMDWSRCYSLSSWTEYRRKNGLYSQ